MFLPETVFSNAKLRLSLQLSAEALDGDTIPSEGDHRLNPLFPTDVAGVRAAAVLIPLVADQGEVRIILTQRASDLPVHSGQIAFPGGKIEAGEDPVTAALREAEEEIGLNARHIEPIGFLEPYLSGSGFRIIPVVAKVEPPFNLAVNPAEVAEAFEVPFGFLMDEANHEMRSMEWNGGMRQFYAMPYGERYIWGVTAGILRNLYERLYS
jgi:8-oxo-dGTP pyrophosphatase MutT (NUDIX family)